jgi:chorismate mutase
MVTEPILKTQQDDPVVCQYREQISDNDLKILEAVNKRIKLVQKLWDYKVTQGLDSVDAARENWVLTYLSRANGGPMSNEALTEVFTMLLRLTKDEIGRLQVKS